MCLDSVRSQGHSKKNLRSSEPILVPYLHRYMLKACCGWCSCCCIVNVMFQCVGVLHIRQMAGSLCLHYILARSTLTGYDWQKVSHTHVSWKPGYLARNCFTTRFGICARHSMCVNIPCWRSTSRLVPLSHTRVCLAKGGAESVIWPWNAARISDPV